MESQMAYWPSAGVKRLKRIDALCAVMSGICFFAVLILSSFEIGSVTTMVIVASLALAAWLFGCLMSSKAKCLDKVERKAHEFVLVLKASGIQRRIYSSEVEVRDCGDGRIAELTLWLTDPANTEAEVLDFEDVLWMPGTTATPKVSFPKCEYSLESGFLHLGQAVVTSSVNEWGFTAMAEQAA